MFWVHASNAARFEQSFRKIANCVKIRGRLDPKADILQLVHDWLQDNRKGRWVLILDNVDDARFLVEGRSIDGTEQKNYTNNEILPPLVSYLPHCSNGTYLVTSRNKNEALRLVEEHNIIAIDPMSEADALKLFEHKLGKQVDGGDKVARLAATLEYIPLAMAQAAAYISQRVPRYSLHQYLEDFRSNDKKKTNLLYFNCDGRQLRRDLDAKNSVIETWQISFDHISSIRPSAADLLSLMSFFDRQGISEGLLRNRYKRIDESLDQQKFVPDTYGQKKRTTSLVSQVPKLYFTLI